MDNYSEVKQAFDLSFVDLMHKAHTVHRQNFDPAAVQISTLLSIKTGTCPEDCAYCPQSGHYQTELDKQSLMSMDDVIVAAKAAKQSGATRFCMGAAWRSPPVKAMADLCDMVKAVKQLGLETCLTAGMVSDTQALQLKQAGLDFYNHNLDSSPEFYQTIITTRTYQQRLDTLASVTKAGIKVCCGGILGMGESREDRIQLLLQLAKLEMPPESIPINLLIKIKGTPLENVDALDPFEFIRMIAVTRMLFPKSYVRLSAGRENMSDETQAWCFYAGANSIFYGETLLTASNPATKADQDLFERLGMHAMEA